MHRTASLRSTLLLTAALLAPAAARADGFALDIQGLYSNGTASAAAASTRDPAGMFANPAVLASLEGTQLVAGGQIIAGKILDECRQDCRADRMKALCRQFVEEGPREGRDGGRDVQASVGSEARKDSLPEPHRPLKAPCAYVVHELLVHRITAPSRLMRET